MNTFDKAEEAVHQLKDDTKRYNECVQCWLAVAPLSPRDFFRRWLFAFASIQTPWSANVKVYKALSDLTWVGDEDALYDRLAQSGSGLQNNRAKWIHAFSLDYWNDPSEFYGKPGESWDAYRTRLVKCVPGIGMAKTSFVLEMTWPLTADVICIDTHIMQLYGCKPVRLSRYKYRELEQHWVTLCRSNGLAPAIARAVYWDRNQGYDNSDYWNCVFKKERSLKEIWNQSIGRG